MPPDADPRPDPDDHLRHELGNALAVVGGHAQLQRRQVGRLDGLAAGDRARLLARADALCAAAGALGALLARAGAVDPPDPAG